MRAWPCELSEETAYQGLFRRVCIVQMLEPSDFLLELTDPCLLHCPLLARFGRVDPSLHLCSFGHDWSCRMRALVAASCLSDHDRNKGVGGGSKEK